MSRTLYTPKVIIKLIHLRERLLKFQHVQNTFCNSELTDNIPTKSFFEIPQEKDYVKYYMFKLQCRANMLFRIYSVKYIYIIIIIIKVHVYIICYLVSLSIRSHSILSKKNCSIG